MPIDQEERYSRQKDLVPMDKLQDLRISVVGVGAIGRQVTLQLAAMGAPWVQIIDFDKVEDGNLAAQGFLETDCSKHKVKAVADLCHQINSEMMVRQIDAAFSCGMDMGDVVFCCVDDIEVRRFIWETVQDKVKLFVDGRMSAEAMRVLVVSDEDSAKYYPTTLFRANEAFRGACTAKTTIYSSNVVAGIMVSNLAKALRDVPLDCDIQFNLLTNEVLAQDVADIKRQQEKERLNG